MLNRFNVLNDPVNFTDPLGLLTSSYYNAYGYSDYDIDYGGAWPGTAQRDNANNNITSGQVWAAGKVVAGSGLIIVGAITLPEGAPLIAIGIPILADGSASSFVEFVLNGDTSAVPPTINHAGVLIIEGAIEAYTKKDKNCE